MSFPVFAGYGHMSPATQGGQLFLIFYAIPGIPLMLVFLAYMGARISNLNQKLSDCMKCFKKPRLNSLLDTAVLVVFGITVFILVPASLFHHMEGWSYITSCYFCVVTLSTVGFGDYVTGKYVICSKWYPYNRLRFGILCLHACIRSQNHERTCTLLYTFPTYLETCALTLKNVHIHTYVHTWFSL